MPENVPGKGNPAPITLPIIPDQDKGQQALDAFKKAIADAKKK